MSQILRFRTLVFMDLEATGVIPEEFPKDVNITEMSFVAIHVNRFNEKLRPPRVFNKLTLCVLPKSVVSPTAMEMTGLFNSNLEYQQKFSASTALLLKHFLYQHEPPICLLAHNGANFDFPLLKAELYAVHETLPSYVYCMDTLTAAKYIIDGHFESNYIDEYFIHTQHQESSASSQNNGNAMKLLNNPIPDGPLNPEPSIEIDGFGAQTQNCFRNIDNSITPYGSYGLSPKRKPVNLPEPSTPHKVKKRLSLGSPKKRRVINFGQTRFYCKDSKGLGLSNIYFRVFGEEMQASHEAESDALNLMKVCHKLDMFLEFIEYNAKRFDNNFFVKPMW